MRRQTRNVGGWLEELRAIVSEAEGAGRPADDAKAVLRLHELLRVLNETGVPFVVIGAHALAAYTRDKRDTKDLDVVCKAWKKLRAAVEKAFPSLVSELHGDAIRFKQGDDEILDILKPTGIYKLVLKNTAKSHVLGHEVTIPDRETLLVTKYAAGVSPHRRRDRSLQDEVDFVRIVDAAPSLDRAKIKRLAASLWEGADADVLRLIDLAKDEKRRFSFFDRPKE